MKIISTAVHGVLDYVVGMFLIVSPWILNFAEGGPQTWIPIILGAGTFAYSLMTNYEMGVFKFISMNGHLTMDALSGILLATSPWIFGFANNVYLPHLILGLTELCVVLMTKTATGGVYRHSATT